MCPRSFLCSGLVCSGLLPPCLLPSFFFLSFCLPSPGGWLVTVLFRYDPIFPSFVSPLSFPFTSLAGGGVWYCSLLSPSLPVSFPASLVFPFSFCPLVGSDRFCARLSGFPSFFFFPSLLVSLSFLISFFPCPGVGWSLFCYCCVVVFHFFRFPLYFPLSSFPGCGGNVLFCHSLSIFPSFPFISLVVLSSFLPSFLLQGHGWLRFWCVLFPSFLIALSSLLSFSLRGGWSRSENLTLDKRENSRHARQAPDRWTTPRRLQGIKK